MTDVVLEKHYKEDYLRYIQSGNPKQRDANKMNQSMLHEQSTTAHDEEAQKFDTMLQSKQDEIILESLKVGFFSLHDFVIVNR